MGTHINAEGEFQSDKVPECPAGWVPLRLKDPTAMDLLWEYAQRRRAVDPEFSSDLEAALQAKGFVPPKARMTAGVVFPMCTCGANAACAGAGGQGGQGPSHRPDCELSKLMVGGIFSVGGQIGAMP